MPEVLKRIWPWAVRLVAAVGTIILLLLIADYLYRLQVAASMLPGV